MKKTNVRKMNILKYFFEEPERKRLAKGRKEKIKEFFHKAGLYRTPEEKKQIALQKESQRKEKESKKLEELRIKEQEEIRKQRELESIAKERPSGKLSKFYSILHEAYKSLESEDAPKLDEKYINARDLFDVLSSVEQQQAYDDLTELYSKRNALIKRLEQAEEKKRKMQAREEKEKIQKAERERLAKERKEKIKELFHRIGLYRTPEEKKQIALQKESQRKEKESKKLEELKRKEQQRRQREIEESKKQEEIRKKQAEEEKRELDEQKIQSLSNKRKEIKPSLRKFMSELSIESRFFNILPFYRKKSEEPEQYKEKEPKASEDDTLKGIEDRIKAREEERRDKEEQKRLKQEEKLRAKEEKKRQKELEQLKKQKSGIGKKEAKDIFKDLLGFGEAAPAKAKRSKNLEKCLKLISDSKGYAGSSLEKARKLYIEARNMYLKLDYHEKKEAYRQLMGLYNTLIE